MIYNIIYYIIKYDIYTTNNIISLQNYVRLCIYNIKKYHITLYIIILLNIIFSKIYTII